MAKPYKPLFDGPIPGQSWQHAPRTMPYDRPPQFADTNKALVFMFKRLRQPVVTKQILNLIDAQIPVDFIVESILTTAFREGTIGASNIIPMVGPLVVILIRMAETAGLHPITSNQKSKNTTVDPMDIMAASERMKNNNQVEKATGAIDKSSKELNNDKLTDKQGFMAFRPKPKSNGGLI